MDSEQQGERQNALEVYHTERSQHDWPRCVDLLHALNNTVPRADYEKLESVLAGWIATADQRGREIQILRAGLGLMTGLKRGAVLAVAIGIIYGGYHLLWADANATDALSRTVLAEMKPGLARSNKTFLVGDSNPTVHYLIEGQPFWIITRSELDSTSHVDQFGKPAPRQCQHYFVSPAQHDDTPPAGFLKPEPYSFLGRLKWPAAGVLCQQSP